MSSTKPSADGLPVPGPRTLQMALAGLVLISAAVFVLPWFAPGNEQRTAPGRDVLTLRPSVRFGEPLMQLGADSPQALDMNDLQQWLRREAGSQGIYIVEVADGVTMRDLEQVRAAAHGVDPTAVLHVRRLRE